MAACPLYRTSGADEVSHESWQMFNLRCVGIKGCISNRNTEIHWCVPPLPCSLTRCATLVTFPVQSDLVRKQSQAEHVKPSPAMEIMVPHPMAPSSCVTVYAVSCSRDTVDAKEHCELYLCCLTNTLVLCLRNMVCWKLNYVFWATLNIIFLNIPRLLDHVIPVFTSGFACFQLFSVWWWGSSVLSCT